MYRVTPDIAFGGFSERDDVEDADRQWRIINVSGQSMKGDDIHVPLNDGAYDGGNTQATFNRAVDAVRESLGRDEPVFVHCAVGQSRSVSVLATALAAENNRSFEAVRDELMDLRGSFTEPAESLQAKGRTYLNNN